uniref:Uncharacterized protein n=1 Tax=Arion vulgaris TaxID=1028688 RepID=A0A0B6ZMI6_9EUPU
MYQNMKGKNHQGDTSGPAEKFFSLSLITEMEMMLWHAIYIDSIVVCSFYLSVTYMFC